MHGEVAVYNPLSGALKVMNADSIFTGSLADAATTGHMEKTMRYVRGTTYRYSYWILAPVTPVGIAFLGDEGKITDTGRQRIATLKATQKQTTVQVAFAKGESSVHLHGYYQTPFTVDHGSLKLYSSKNTFMLNVHIPKNSNHITIHFTPK